MEEQSTVAWVKDSSSTTPRWSRYPTLGRYVLLEALGRGGMGVVWRAFDPVLERTVALKRIHRIHRPLIRDGGFALLGEARAMARVSHPHVVPVYAVEQVDDEIVLAMELLEGGTLSQWITAVERAPAEIVARIVLAGMGLWAAHQAGVLHRDFKGSNVMLGANGATKVTDFGLAEIGRPPLAMAQSDEQPGGRNDKSGKTPTAMAGTLSTDVGTMRRSAG